MSDALKGPAQEQGELVSNEAKIANIIQHITDLCANNKEKLLDGLLDMDYHYAKGIFETRDRLGTRVTIEQILATVQGTLQEVLHRKFEYERRVLLLPQARALLQEVKGLLPGNFLKEDAPTRKGIREAEELITSKDEAGGAVLMDAEEAIKMLQEIKRNLIKRKQPESALATMIREAMKKK